MNGVDSVTDKSISYANFHIKLITAVYETDVYFMKTYKKCCLNLVNVNNIIFKVHFKIKIYFGNCNLRIWSWHLKLPVLNAIKILNN